MEFLGLLGSVLFLFSVLAALYGLYKFNERKRDKLMATLRRSGFEPRYIKYAGDLTNGLAIDPENEGVAILRPFGKEPVLLDYSEIISVEMMIDRASVQKTIQKTNRGSQLVGAAVGGAVFGKMGAAVGGLSGSKRSETRSSESVTNRSLVIFTSDMEMPSAEIKFSSWSESEFYDWYGRLSAAIRIAEAR